MVKQAGVWVDHRKAVIVMLTPDGQYTSLVISHVEKQPRRAPGSAAPGPYEPLQVPADDRRQRALTKHLNIYYDSIVAALKGIERLLLFGPGEAKGELKKRLVKLKLGARVAATESADKMTDRQIIAKVRSHFKLDSPRRQS